ncbi:hypothetical protein H6P81_011339 [Aristolochia fimbriata]|uniref:Uncharacterized protein n=1 Tax=Aristolochia fimbriata TaxID=158543 RepID=A0AAV7ESI3_ARIFI|nr:hypothetical protein H6P81_011339 [Aristolochia fimbriata]
MEGVSLSDENGMMEAILRPLPRRDVHGDVSGVCAWKAAEKDSLLNETQPKRQKELNQCWVVSRSKEGVNGAARLLCTLIKSLEQQGRVMQESRRDKEKG